jgi:nicotinate-nucleotide pyrophosphorylase (carboxylating)
LEDNVATQNQIEQIIDTALGEDLGSGDRTTELVIPQSMGGTAAIIAKEAAVVCGGEVARIAFMKVDQTLQVKVNIADGQRAKPGDPVLLVTGRVSSILKTERVALNFISHLSGIATATAQFVDRVKGLDVKISDTRKTLPGLRLMEKYAVYAAGGQNHRPDLASGILIKDNHLVALAARGVSVAEAISRAKAGAKGMKVEVEVQNLEQLRQAIEGSPDIIMLDNMPVEEIKKAVKMVPPSISLEASGGITLENVRAVAETGVDVISVGAITHSARAIDFSLSFVTGRPPQQ